MRLTRILVDAALVEKDALVAFNLRRLATEVDDAIDAFKADPTPGNLSILNGLWARATRQMGYVTAVAAP